MKIFSAILINSKNFKILCSVLKDLSIDITMIITDDSIIISSIDKTILLSICLPLSSFLYFNNLQQRIQININTINLYKIVSRIQKNEIELFIQEEHFINSIANILSIKIDNIIIELSLLENEKEELNIMKIEYDLIFHIDSKIFKNIIKSINNISEYLVISTKENSIELSSSSTFAKFIIKPNYNMIKFAQINTLYIDLSILNILSKFTSMTDKIDIFRNDIKIAQIGAIGYDDYPNYMIKYGVEMAEKRRILYKIRHGNDIHKRNSNGFFANLLLW